MENAASSIYLSAMSDALVDSRGESWVKIFATQPQLIPFLESIGHCERIEGAERTARLLVSAFPDEPLGIVLAHCLSTIDALRQEPPNDFSERIVYAVAKEFEIEVYELRSPSRTRDVVIPRFAAIYLLTKLLPSLSLTAKARLVGRRDHSTIIHAYRAFASRLSITPMLQARIERLEMHLRETESKEPL